MTDALTTHNFFFTYVGEIGADATIAWANFVLFSWVLIFALVTQTLFDSLGAGWTFALFAVFNLVATTFMWLVLKDISGLSMSEKKAIFSAKGASIQHGSAMSIGYSNEVHGG